MEAPLPVARMPAEWEPHERCWMAWPDGAIWEDDLAPVEREYAEIARAISRFEPVVMVANPRSASRARNLLGREIEVIELPIDDAWFRDSGPTFVHLTDGTLAGICWRFNGWGGANPEFAKDAAVARLLLAQLGLPAVTSALAMEGGALAVDGQGTLMTTESVVFNENRNPGITRGAAEAEFARTLGAARTIWLPGDAEEYGTNGHIDGIACYAARGALLFEQAPGDRAAVSARNLQALEAANPGLHRPSRAATAFRPRE
ncbi:MAG: agmatine deiminase family protein, partial [Pseudomonadota bacterium]